LIIVCHIVFVVRQSKYLKLSLCLSPSAKEKKDWFAKLRFARASHGELPFERAEIVFGFQKSL